MYRNIQELEKKFFKTFGIEPIAHCEHGCNAENLKTKCSECIYVDSLEYPQITDTIVLKLMCIIANYDEQYRGFYTEYEQIKPCILFELLMIFDALTICPWSKPYMNISGGAAKLICDIRKVFKLQE